MKLTTKNNRLFRIAEFAVIMVALPLVLYATGTRLGIYLSLWGAGLYAYFMLRRAPDFSFRKIWEGEAWAREAKRNLLLRFFVLAAVLAVLTLVLVPEKFFRFPLDRFPLWLAVMVLYPILSIVPQELFFRSFYFRRYGDIIPGKWPGILVNGLLFGFSHIVLNNWIAPTFCAVGGALFAYSYSQHRSLKWSVIEHTLYGCWVFTVGIGYYFFTGNWRG